jgi:hypothetical protein
MRIVRYLDVFGLMKNGDDQKKKKKIESSEQKLINMNEGLLK